MKTVVENMSAVANWGGWLEPVAWKSWIILALVFVLMTWWRHGTAAGRHLAWMVTFLCLLCLPVFVYCLPAWPAPAWMVPSVLNNTLPDSLSLDLQNNINHQPQPAAAASGTQANTHGLAAATQSAARMKPAIRGHDIAFMIWLAGTILGLLRLLIIQIRLERMAGRMRPCENRKCLNIMDQLRAEYRIRRPMKLLISGVSASPVTWGFVQPIVVLPMGACDWPEERLQVVLRHELAHVKRRDCLTQEIARVACVLYWFNPLAWLAARRMRAEREKACDDFVLNAGVRPTEYAGHLVEIARLFSASDLRGAIAMASPSGLESRVLAILDHHRNRNRLAKMTAVPVILSILGAGWLIAGCSHKNSPEKWSLKHSVIAPQLKSFIAEKEAQANAAANNGQGMPPEFKPFFTAAVNGDWLTVSNMFKDFMNHTPQYAHSGKTETDERLRGTAFAAMFEVYGALEFMTAGDEKYFVPYGREIIDSIPPGSIYFGGTDPGRFLITGMEKSQINADPFYLLTQNALADGGYLGYLQSMYGNQIYIPTASDQKKCFDDYTADLSLRFQNHRLKPGENYKESDGRPVISGSVAVMQINGLLAKIIFDKNPDREFYIETSFPLDWMYPYLEPHGLIFKINRQPLAELSEEIVQRDHDYWTKTVQPMIGDWLHDDTSVQEIADFAQKVFGQHDFSGFTGDPQFVQNDYSCKMFSKERANIADLYVWRMNHPTVAGEKERMAEAADFAYRQALALCPYSTEAANGYESFLKSRNRDADAALIEAMVAQLPKPR
jgi:beta-lactamase regulating signal transducer with metallopeptidase domain